MWDVSWLAGAFTALDFCKPIAGGCMSCIGRCSSTSLRLETADRLAGLCFTGICQCLAGRWPQFPSLLCKSVWFAVSKEDLTANVRSLMCGLGIKGHSRHCWRPALHRFMHRLRLHRVHMHKLFFRFHNTVEERKNLISDFYLSTSFKCYLPVAPLFSIQCGSRLKRTYLIYPDLIEQVFFALAPKHRFSRRKCPFCAFVLSRCLLLTK